MLKHFFQYDVKTGVTGWLAESHCLYLFLGKFDFQGLLLKVRVQVDSQDSHSGFQTTK